MGNANSEKKGDSNQGVRWAIGLVLKRQGDAQQKLNGTIVESV